MLSLLHWRRPRAEARPAAPGDLGRDQNEHNLRVLLTLSATHNAAWDLVTPFMALFILEFVNGDPVAAAAWTGIVVGAAPLMSAISAPFWSVYAERRGARTAMLQGLIVGPFLVMLITVATAMWQVLILRLLIGMFGAFFVLVHALIAQTAPRDRVGQAIGMLQAISMICLAVVPPVAGAFTDHWGLRSNFLVGAGVMLFSFGFMWLGYRPVTPEAASGKPSDHRAGGKKGGVFLSQLKSPVVAMLAVIVFVGQFVERTFWPLAPLLVVEMEPASTQLGLMTGAVLGIGSGATALSALAAGRLCRRLPPRALLLGSLALGSLVIPLMGLAESFWQLMGLRAIMGLVTGGTVTLAYAYSTLRLPSERLSASFSVFACVAMASSAVGPISISALGTTLGLRAPLMLGGIAFALCVVLLLVGSRSGASAPSERSTPAEPA